MSQLKDPPEYLRIRDIKPWYVNYLADMMETSHGDHEDLTSPLLVVASVNKQDFKLQSILKYTFKVFHIIK